MDRATRINAAVLTAMLIANSCTVSNAQAQAQADVPCTVIGTVTGDSSQPKPTIEGIPLAQQDHSKPIKGATVTFKGEGAMRQTHTDKDGSYKIAVPCGSYIVEATAPSFAPEHLQVTLSPSANGKVSSDVGFGLESRSAAKQRAQANAQIERRNAMLARPYSTPPMRIMANLSADVQAFNDSEASQTSGCSAMARMVNLAPAPNRRTPTLGDEIVHWSMEANAAKVCASDTRDSPAERLPRFILSRACDHLREHFNAVNEVYRSETSWACGWPAPIPAMRTIPGIMPPGYNE